MENDGTRASVYLREWHERHPGATAAALGPLVDEGGRSSYEILAEALQGCVDPVLDLACGDGPLLSLLGPASIGADASVAELDAAQRRLGPTSPLLQADAACLPVATGAIGTVSCHYALMLLQPLERVLAELGRVLRRDGFLAVVLPGLPPEDPPTPWAALRSAWQEVTTRYPVEVPPLQDARALQPTRISALLADAGFHTVITRPFVVAKVVTLVEAEGNLLLTYLPDLLPVAGLAELRRELQAGLAAQADADGLVTFAEHAVLLTAFSGSPRPPGP